MSYPSGYPEGPRPAPADEFGHPCSRLRKSTHLIPADLREPPQTVVGLSNVFGPDTDLDETWVGVISLTRHWCGSLPMVGYESGEDLAAAIRSGFTAIGPLRVWST